MIKLQVCCNSAILYMYWDNTLCLPSVCYVSLNLVTGGKSVSEIVQILRTNANLKLKVSNLDDQEDVEEIPNNTSQIFPWLKKFTAQCKDTILEPDIKKLDDLITSFLKYVLKVNFECYLVHKNYKGDEFN